MLTCSNFVKSLPDSFLFLIVAFGFMSCGNDHPVDSSVGLTPIKSNIISTKENDQRFLVRATEMKYEQIYLGKLVQQRSGSEEVRQLAKMIEESNREEKSSIASLAIMKSIGVPSAATKNALDAYDKLNEASVEDFDVTYLDQVIQGYKEAINLFENATRENLDPEIHSLALAMLPDMRNHLSKAMELNTHMNPLSELVR